MAKRLINPLSHDRGSDRILLWRRLSAESARPRHTRHSRRQRRHARSHVRSCHPRRSGGRERIRCPLHPLRGRDTAESRLGTLRIRHATGRTVCSALRGRRRTIAAVAVGTLAAHRCRQQNRTVQPPETAGHFHLRFPFRVSLETARESPDSTVPDRSSNCGPSNPYHRHFRKGTIGHFVEIIDFLRRTVKDTSARRVGAPAA